MALLRAMDQRAAGKLLNQTIVYGIEVLRIFPREAEQPAGLIDNQQMRVLMEYLYLLMARWGNKGIENGRHLAARLESGCG